MRATLETWAQRYQGKGDALYWILDLKMVEIDAGSAAERLDSVEEGLRESVRQRRESSDAYWADIRYSALEPVTQLWGTIVNAVRVVAESDRATEAQKQVFAFEVESLVEFFRSARARMEIADGLYHAFKAMPAPECQAMAALLNVHVDAPLEGSVMCRLVRLLDHEGPMSDQEQQDLAALSNTHLVDAAFKGLRRSA